MKLTIIDNDVNPLGTSIKIRNRLRKAIKRLDHYDEFAYRRFINYLSRLNEVTEDNIFVGHDLTCILKTVINALKIEKLLVPLPVHNSLLQLTKDLNLHIEPFNAGPYFNKIYDFDKLNRIFNKSDLVLLSNPHKLTGKFINNNQWDELIEISKRKNAVIIIDESLIDYTDIITPVKKIVSSKDILIIRTFSTFFALSGLPFGYALGNKEIISKLKKLLTCRWNSISQLAYIGALTALKDKHYRKRTMEYLKNEKQYIRDKLKGYTSFEIIDTSCNFLLIRFLSDKSFLEDELKKRNIFLEAYDDTEGFFLRFPLQKHKYNAYFVKTLREILQKKGT